MFPFGERTGSDGFTVADRQTDASVRKKYYREYRRVESVGPNGQWEWLEQVVLTCAEECLRATANLKFAEDVVDMLLHGRERDDQRIGDLLV